MHLGMRHPIRTIYWSDTPLVPLVHLRRLVDTRIEKPNITTTIAFVIREAALRTRDGSETGGAHHQTWAASTDGRARP